MPKPGVAAVLLSLPALFQPGLGTSAQTCIDGDDEVCLLQRLRSEQQHVAVDEAGEDPAAEEMGVMEFDMADELSTQCTAVGAKMWMFSRGIQQTAQAITVRSMKDVSEDVPFFSGGAGWTSSWNFNHGKMKVKVGKVETKMHPRHGVWMTASEVKVDFRAEYVYKATYFHRGRRGNASTTTNSNTSMGAIFFLNVGPNGRLDLSMQSDWKLVMDPLKIDGKGVSDKVLDLMLLGVEHKLNEILAQRFDHFVKTFLRPKLLAQDMVVPITMNTPLDGFTLKVPLCSLDIDTDQIVFNVEGIVSHPDAGNLTYDVPMPTPLLVHPPNQAQQFMTDITEWSLNGGLWLAYQMGRFHLTPNSILGHQNKEKRMKNLGAVAEPKEGDARKAGILDFRSEAMAFEAPTASFMEQGKVRISMPLDVDFWVESSVLPELWLSIRSTSTLELSVSTPSEDRNPIQGKLNLIDIGKVEVRFDRGHKVHYDLLDAFVEEWLRTVMVPVMDYIISRYAADFGFLADISEETTFENTMISTFKQHMFLATDMQVGPFHIKPPAHPLIKPNNSKVADKPPILGR